MIKSGAQVPGRAFEGTKRTTHEENEKQRGDDGDGAGVVPVRLKTLSWVNAELTHGVRALRPPDEAGWQPAAHGFEASVLDAGNPHGFTEQRLIFLEWTTTNFRKDGPLAHLGGRRLLFRIGVNPVPKDGYRVWLQDNEAPGQYAEWMFPLKHVAPLYPHAATLLSRAPPHANIEPCFVRVGDKIGFATAYHPDGTYAVRFDSEKDEKLAVPWWRVESYERQDVQSGFICRICDNKQKPLQDPRLRLEGFFVNRVHKTAGGEVKVQMLQTSLVKHDCEVHYTYDTEAIYEVPWALKDMTTVEDMFSLVPTKPYLFRTMFAYLFVQEACLGMTFVSNVYGTIQRFRDGLKQEWRPIVRQELLFRVRVLAEKNDDWWDDQTNCCIEIFRDPNEEALLPVHTVPDLRRAVRAVRGFCAAMHAVRSHMEEFCKVDAKQSRVQLENLRDTMMLTHKGRVGEFWNNMIEHHGEVPMVVEAATTLGYLDPAPLPTNPFEHEGGFDDQVLQSGKSGKSDKSGKKKRKKPKKKKRYKK